MRKIAVERWARHLGMAVGAAAVALVSAVRAEESPDLREVRFPNAPHRVGPYYPEYAHRRGQKGAAEIACHVAAGGVLKDCVAIRETGDWGFGIASVIMARRRWIIAGAKTDGSTENPDSIEHFLVRFD